MNKWLKYLDWLGIRYKPTRIGQIKELIKIQGQDGNWNASPYMTGLYNGLELALATLEDRTPKYKDIVK